MIKLGDIIFYKNIPEFGAWLQRWVTNTIYSHVSISLGNKLSEIDAYGEFEADLKVRLHSFHRRSKNMDVLKIIGVPYQILWSTLKAVIILYEGKTYGFISWLTIAIRYVFEKLGFKEVYRWNILWGWGVICSELVYYYFIGIADQMIDGRETNLILWTQLRYELSRHQADTFTPKDIELLARAYPELFEWDIE